MITQSRNKFHAAPIKIKLLCADLLITVAAASQPWYVKHSQDLAVDLIKDKVSGRDPWHRRLRVRHGPDKAVQVKKKEKVKVAPASN